MSNKKSKIPTSQQQQSQFVARILNHHSSTGSYSTHSHGSIGSSKQSPPPKSVSEFVLENELPGLDAAVQRGEASLLQQHSHASAGSCCSHLLSIFPQQLCIELMMCHNRNGINDSMTTTGMTQNHHGSWYLKDPVSALHLQSQLEQDGSINMSSTVATPSSQPLSQKQKANVESGTKGTIKSDFGEISVLYGEEQERWNAIRTEGIPEIYHPYIIPSTIPQENHADEDEDAVVADDDKAAMVDPKRQKTTDILMIAPTVPSSGIGTTTIKPLPSPPRLMVPRTSSTGSSSKYLPPSSSSLLPTEAITSITTVGTDGGNGDNGNNVRNDESDNHNNAPTLVASATTDNTATTATSTDDDTIMIDCSSSSNNIVTTAQLPQASTNAVMDGIFPMPSIPPVPTLTSQSAIVSSPGGKLSALTDSYTSLEKGSSDIDPEGIAENRKKSSNSDKTPEISIDNTDSNNNGELLVTKSDQVGVGIEKNSMVTSPPPAATSESTTVTSEKVETSMDKSFSEGNASVEMMNSSHLSIAQPSHSTKTAATVLVMPTDSTPQFQPSSKSSENGLETSSATKSNKADQPVRQPETQQVTMMKSDVDTNVEYLLSDATFNKYHSSEERIKYIQQNLLSTKRLSNKNKKSGMTASNTGSVAPSSMIMTASKMGPSTVQIQGNRVQSSTGSSYHSSMKQKLPNSTVSALGTLSSNADCKNDFMTTDDMTWYYEKQSQVITYSKLLVENFIRARHAFWFDYKKRKESMMVPSINVKQLSKSRLKPSERPVLFQSNLTPDYDGTKGFGSIVSDEEDSNQSLRTLATNMSRQMDDHIEHVTHDECDLPQQNRSSDTIIQCLECSVSGYLDSDITASGNTRRMYQHNGKSSIQHHFLSTNHKFGVTMESQPRIYCFHCGLYMQHEVFENEQHRIDVSEVLPWMSWNEYGGIHRSFDALQFVNIPDVGVIWKGMKATYPIIAAKEHILAARICHYRYMMFCGEVEQLPHSVSSFAFEFTKQQQMLAPKDRYGVSAPVGIYNLGNTCFMSAILHCLIHCSPLQRFFLHDVGHNHVACNIYRMMNMKIATEQGSRDASTKSTMKSVCLACEMDKLFLRYVGSTKGIDLLSVVDASSLYSIIKKHDLNSSSDNRKSDLEGMKGSPLLTADMLAAAWKCGGMKHLAGYEQRDAHEFLHGFLEILGKHMSQYRVRVHAAINSIQLPRSLKRKADVKRNDDEIKNLFEGSLRSVLVCLECGSKRIQPETFMSMSLPLSKGGLASTVQRATGVTNETLDIETCLRHFTLPETLTDPVMCPNCDKKTQTKKQHVVSKLPKLLCLHFKRFDAATNKKIEEFVSFPCHGLNMGPFLPHWCEVSRAPVAPSIDSLEHWAVPEIKYDLYATVNHFGNLQSGHYVSNVFVNGHWYHCNDSFVGFATEAEVLRSQGAYLLFYIRR